jgi:Ca2+-binding RTX toxin-like protein
VRARKTTLALGALALAGVPFVPLGSAQAAPATCNGREVTIDLNNPMAPEASTGSEGTLPIFDGTAEDDVILGTPNAEIIHGLGGDDVICARGGGDRVYGGAGKDRLFGGGGDDQLRQQEALEGLPVGGLLAGGDGEDRLTGAAGNDTVRGGQDSDVLVGNLGNDALDGGTGTTIAARPGSEGLDLAVDDCNGGPGRDREANCENSRNFP